MTDITDRDRRKALAWAGGSQARGGADAAARYILATVEAPEPTLAEEIMRLPDYTMSGDHCLNDCYDQAKDLANRAGRMETEHAEQALRIDELDQECDRQCLEILDLTSERDTALAEVERLTAEWDDRPAADLPDPADVPAGQPWEVVAADPAKKIGGGITKHNAVAFRMTDRWVVSRNGYQTPLVVPDHCVSLVRRLVPAPRTITTREDLDALPEATVIRDVDGMVCEHVNLGTRGMQWLAVGIDETYPVQNPTLPATVLWTPEVEA